MRAAWAIFSILIAIVVAYVMLTYVIPEGLYEDQEPTREITLSSVESSDPQAIHMHYEWKYEHNEYSWDIAIPSELRQYAENKPRISSSQVQSVSRRYSTYITDPRDDNLLKTMVASIDNLVTKEGLSEVERLYTAITFVQSVPYGYDTETTGQVEYPRYPVETLVDNVGDCEDTSILMGALLREMGYDVALIIYENIHTALGVCETDDMNFYGTYYQKEGKRYYYLETTSEGRGVGEIPDKYSGKSASVFGIIPVPIFTHTWQSSWYGTSQTVTVIVKNEGTAAAEGVSVKVGFEDTNSQLWNVQDSESFNLEPNSEGTVALQLQRTTGKYVRMAVYVIYEGYTYDKSYSDWFST